LKQVDNQDEHREDNDPGEDVDRIEVAFRAGDQIAEARGRAKIFADDRKADRGCATTTGSITRVTT